MIYARLSLDPHGTEAGVERQVVECHEYAEQQGWTVVHEYTDNDISATTGRRRPAFEQLLSEVRPPIFVLCWHLDRLVRLARDLERVIDAGLFVHAKHAGHLDLSTAAGRAVARTITAWSAYEGEQKAERIKSAHVQRARAGRPWWNRRPFGYNQDGTAHAVEGPAVVELYRRAHIRPNLSELARWLNEQGFRTSANKNWRSTGVRSLLLGARNAGISTYRGQEVGPGNWDALIDEETFRSVTRTLNARRHVSGELRLGQGRRLYLLTGFARCGTCGATVRSGWPGGKQYGYRTYLCPAGYATALGEWVDDRTGTIVLDSLAHSERQTTGTASPDSSEGLAASLRAEIERLEDKGQSYASMFDEDELTADQFQSINRANRARISDLRSSLAEVSLTTALHGLLDVQDAAEHWSTYLTVAEQRTIVVSFFERIVIQPRGKSRVRGMRSGDVEFWVRGETRPRL